MQDEEKTSATSFAREVGKGIVEEGKSTLRWVLGSALVGALLVGGAGAWFFGMDALLYGAAIGAVIGALGALWLSAGPDLF